VVGNPQLIAKVLINVSALYAETGQLRTRGNFSGQPSIQVYVRKAVRYVVAPGRDKQFGSACQIR
jgi:hypothetical protein